MPSRPGGVDLRAPLAVALYLGFHGLGLALVALFAWLPWTEASYGQLEPFGALSGGCALWVVWSKIPRIRRFEAPGALLSREGQPQLFALLEGLAAEVGARPPDEVYLLAQANALIGYRRRWGPFGRICYVAVGYPMLLDLDVGRLRAILAHEIGHHHAGDLKLGPWVYSTRASIATAVERLEVAGSPMHLPFLLYGRLFLRISMAISRRQELAADALAGRLCGRNAAVAALDWVESGGTAWHRYWRDDVIPLLRRGFQPPISEGWRMFLADPQVQAVLAPAAAEPEKTSSDDTHPSHAERVAALAESPDLPPRPGDGEPAAALLADGIEGALCSSLLTDPAKVTFEPIRWDEAADRVWLPLWAELCAPHQAVLDAVVPAGIPAAIADLDAFSARLHERGILTLLSPLAERKKATGLLGFALARWLRDQGWTPSVWPGIAVRFSRGDRTVDPLEAVRQLADGRMSGTEFLATFSGSESAV